MGQTSDQIETTSKASAGLESNLQELEGRVKSATDWRHYFNQNPGMVIAAAFRRRCPSCGNDEKTDDVGTPLLVVIVKTGRRSTLCADPDETSGPCQAGYDKERSGRRRLGAPRVRSTIPTVRRIEPRCARYFAGSTHIRRLRAP